MAHKKFWLGMLVMVLVFGMTVISCDNDTTGSGGGGGDLIEGMRPLSELIALMASAPISEADATAFLSAITPGFAGWLNHSSRDSIQIIMWTSRTIDDFNNTILPAVEAIFGQLAGTAVESGVTQRYNPAEGAREGNLSFFSQAITGPFNGTNIYLNLPANMTITIGTVMLYIR